MKKLILLSLIFLQYAYAKEITITYDSVAFRDSKKIDKTIEFIKKSYENIGIKVILKDQPLARSFKNLIDNKSDADLGRYARVVHQFNLNYIDVPLFQNDICLYSDKKITKPLKELNVAYIRGGKAIELMTFKSMVSTDSIDQSILIFKNRKNIDAIISLSLLLEKELKKDPNNKIQCQKVVAHEDVFHVISKKNVHLKEKLEVEFKKYFPLKD